MNLPPLQPVDLAVRTPVSSYMKAIAAVCPFIEPSAQAGCLHGCVIAPDCHSDQDIHPRLFEQLVPLVERFRDARRALVEKQQRLLICHTVVIHVPPHLNAQTARLLNWPNWLSWGLKQLYTPKEIVFGFVRRSAIEKTQSGRIIPPAPFHAVIIRSRVVSSDQRFFPNNQPLLEAMMQADDDGQDAHAAMFGDVPDIRNPQALREAGYFDRVRKWGQQTVASQQPPGRGDQAC